MTVDLGTSRRTLPAPMVDRSSYSIFSVIKQAIGKDLTRFSIPVVWNEPLSFLQRLAECLEYSSLLDRVAAETSPVERLHLITAFVVSSLSTHLERMSKPFNPLLGETYELKSDGDQAFHYVAEQVSHHPPISALHARGEQWTLTASIEPKMKLQGTNVVASSEDRWTLRIVKKAPLSTATSHSSFHSCTEETDETVDPVVTETDDEYTWTTPTVLIHNILLGRLWCELQGQMDIRHTQSTQHALLTIKSHSWFASSSTKAAELFKYTGFILDGDEKLGAFHGHYGHCYYAIDELQDMQTKPSSVCSAGGNSCIHLNSNVYTTSPPCDLNLTSSSRLIWHRAFVSVSDEELSKRHQYYFFTPFAMCLNAEDHSGSLPPTDCRFRQDIRQLENGNLDAAAAEKHRLEEQQRAEARARVGEFQPLWFKKLDHGEYIYTGDYDGRVFDHCPHLFSRSSAL